ncbi:hypothetical protein BKG80_24515 [Mycobacteroides chelonae]|uniref:hypothetical protein n=1 Tax=Mycobacteroides TaxID=670516 RepID=UPI0007144532|nr:MULTISPECIES: hypothetical protein [Mycobacteroides]KRQ19779.1 hypothetical protein AOT86_24375 [Mycobacteroides sp. H072]KRQ35131.1 hypothetical protein AOT84_17370 [Mycobacteroides sp. H002]KRQ54291.1 hypothetical protein AOT85_04905 [Mycobacteroides sp. H054]KRQ66416.1 hypothetical protein AOT83_23245 [Mycobacteroides sp. H001]MBF9351125.1 hypothetical protein [Mycobacteroides chelonae]
MDDRQRSDDHALNAVTARGFADRDDQALIRELVSAPFPAGADGLVEAGWMLVPLLQTRSGTPVAAAAEARLAAIVGMLSSHRLRPGHEKMLADLDQHRRLAGRSQRHTDLGASIIVGILLAGLCALVLWAVSLLGPVVLLATAIILPIAVALTYLVIRRLERDDTAAHRVRIHGLEVSTWLGKALPAEHAIAVDLALRLPPGAIHALTVNPLVIVAGQGKTAVLSQQTLIADAAALTDPCVEAAAELLAGYLSEPRESVVIAPDIPRPVWAGPWPAHWESLAGEVCGDYIEWMQWRGVLAGFTDFGGVFTVNLAAIGPNCPTEYGQADQYLATVLRTHIADPDSDVVRFHVGGTDSDRSALLAVIDIARTGDSRGDD